MKKPLLITFSVLILLVIAAFTLQNNQSTVLDFFFWSAEGSLAWLTILSFLLGALFSFVLMLPSWFGKKNMNKDFERKKDMLMNDKVELNDKIKDLKAEVEQLKQQQQSEDQSTSTGDQPSNFDPIR
jgi:uncharacterized integral membrane protein